MIESYYRGVPREGNLLEYVADNGKLKVFEKRKERK